MDFNEDELPQKQRLPQALKKYGCDESELRELCPINGTRISDKPKPLTEKARNAYRNRKERGLRKTAKKRELGDESLVEESGGNGVKRRKASSPLGGTQPDPTSFQGAFHMFSINDPIAPAVRIDEHLIPQHASTAPIHSSHLAFPTATETHNKCAANLLPSAMHTQSQFLYNTNASDAMANACGTHLSSTTLDLKADDDLPSTNHAWSPPPTRFSGSPTSSAASPPTSDASGLSPASSDEKENGWTTDEFIATDRSFFVPRSPSTCRLDQAPAPEMNWHDADAPHQAISEPAPLVHSTATTTSISAIVSNGIGRHDLRDMNRGSDATLTNQHGDGLIAWSASPAVAAQIDGPPRDVVNAANTFGYALGHATDVHNSPPAIPSSIHPRPPKLSSYSELAPASHFVTSTFANHLILPPMVALTATFHTTTPSEFADALLHDHRSARVLGTYSQEPVYLTPPYVAREVAVSENNDARAFQENFDDREPEPSSADIESPLGEDFAAQQSPIAITMDNASTVIYGYARVAQESVTCGDQLLSEISSPHFSTGFAINDAYHQPSHPDLGQASLPSIFRQFNVAMS